jgi:hypothetical protein
MDDLADGGGDVVPKLGASAAKRVKLFTFITWGHA